MIKENEIQLAINDLEIANKDICIHSSMHSFGDVIQGGINSIINTFLENGCTILVPTFTDMFEAKPEERYMPEQNGAGDYSYFLGREYNNNKVFNTKCKDISTEDMGILSEGVLNNPESQRGNHPLNSFTGLGKNAIDLISKQSHKNIYAPLEQLYENDGYVLFMGTALDSATIIHYAEQVSGRTPFIRWAYDVNNKVIPVSAGGCSNGFNSLYEYLKPYKKSTYVGKSLWTAISAKDIVDICVNQIKENPYITHCKNPNCDRCKDAIKGGPILSKSFWDEIE